MKCAGILQMEADKVKLTLNVYDEKGKVKKICEAQTVDLEFGTVRSLMTGDRSTEPVLP